MATVNKDFKIKQGLVVEGSTATVAGNNILVANSQATDSYITNLVGGVAYIKSVSSDFGVDLAGELTINGSSDLARTGDITTALADYTTTAGLDAAIGSLGYITGAALNGYATESFVTTQGYLVGSDLNGYATESFVTTQGYLIGADLNGYVTETGTQTLTNKTIGDTLNFTGAGDMTINSDSHIVLTPATGSSVKWGSDVLATQTYADAAVTAHNDLTTGVHGVTGDVVGTTDIQDISNKRVIDTLNFSDGVTVANEGEIAVKAVSHEFEIKSNNGDLHLITVAAGSDVLITADDGDIVLNADGTVYVGSATAGNEVATHGYVDNAISGLDWKQAVNLRVDYNINVAGNQVGAVFDGHAALTTADAGYRFLVTDQNTASENGLWESFVDGAALYFRRPADADAYTELVGAAVYVMEGTQYGSTSWVQGNHYLTDFSGQDWTQFSGQGSVTAGTGIVVDGLEVSVDFTVVAEVQDLTDGLALKQDTLTASTGITIDGSNNISVTANTYDAYGSAAAITPTSLGLGNVDNTSDANKPVSTATQTALDAKADAANPTLTGSLNLDGTGDFTISADAGIILAATTESYIGSANAGNEIATEGYVDAAIDGVTIDPSGWAGSNIDWDGTQFNVNVSGVISDGNIATNTSVGSDITTAIDALTTDAIEEGTTNLYFTDQKTIDAISGSHIQPLSIDINTYRTEEATRQVVASASTVTAHTFTGNRSVKYLVRTVGTVSGTVHSQVTELLVTVDGGNNVAVTEYGTIYTSENPLATATMDYDAINEEYRLRVTTAISGAEVVVAATILTWD